MRISQKDLQEVSRGLAAAAIEGALSDGVARSEDHLSRVCGMAGCGVPPWVLHDVIVEMEHAGLVSTFADGTGILVAAVRRAGLEAA